MSDLSDDQGGPELVVDFDPDVWVALERDDLDSWASETAARCWSEAGLPDGDPGIAMLGSQLLYLGERLADDPALVVLHLRHPELGPVTAALVTAFHDEDWPGDTSEEKLREVLNVDDPALIEPATVERVDTPLGSAMRARRYLEGETSNHGTAVLVTVSFAWHVPAQGSIVRLTTASFELGELAMIEPDIDDLAQVVRIDP